MRKGKIFTRYDYERLWGIIQNKECVSGDEAGNMKALKRDLEHSRLVEPGEIRSNIVTMNSKFYLKNLGNGKKDIYSLVFPKDSTEKNKISVFSGLGMQLLGSTIGTVVKPNPSGEQYYIIDDIVYQPEAAGDYHL
ncbi:MAG TPA: GreA/GreB family elongation factor [Spirochaetota bacterium]|nr:GreA/GreB family elongation factor [Spirochaetota bacterium]HPC41271.1 GreA/GreB family elongation factor [Spirochaetota bacterium]HPL15690.1 GreA/GreB family elongation factor [Spirochaetota bacterium]HQF08117.1 GreA/GreB family elongation factor [Spirochaetota bacterium]HQH96996.1 GreA/GreB family elongation factor [Spirochaetota bacterium]